MSENLRCPNPECRSDEIYRADIHEGYAGYACRECAWAGGYPDRG